MKDKEDLSKLRLLCRSLAAITLPTMGQREAICQDNRSNDTSLSARPQRKRALQEKQQQTESIINNSPQENLP
ncbi:unnamed protein product [Larinioides sclopetarius]|uniref:Uncharacterized protein n=1 Tax=Larinioides sclopetarius TaxID=280406 RepID=A0AAV2BUQ3_9ARAC